MNKINNNYKLVFLIVLMLLLLTLVLSFVNYKTTFTLVHNQIEEQSLPLSLDNIYTEVQENILKPYLITSMIANDTLVKKWILEDKEETKVIQEYLYSIKKEYDLLSVILVSDKTKNYYTQNGFLEKLNINNRDNSWYFRFKKSSIDKEINIDKNEKIDSSYIMFMNNKIFDKQNNLIGITSCGIKIDAIYKMLHRFREKYHLEVYIYDKDSNVILGQGNIKNLKEISEFKDYTKRLQSKKTLMFEYILDGDKYIVNKKYINELNLHIVVKAKVKDFTSSLERSFYISILISFIVSILITIAILYIVRTSLHKLEQSNEQKDILLKEVHHRVKNNLNIIGSMLGLQAFQEDNVIKKHLMKGKSRIDAIAAVHEMLYKQDNLKEINFFDYINKIELLTSKIVTDTKGLQLDIDIDKEFVLALDKMVQFGLMINEMFTNTFKYAKNSKGLYIKISLEKSIDGYVFYYKDNGEVEVDIDNMNNSKGLGTKLINICANQLNAKVKKSYENGLSYEVSFKI